MWDLRQKETQNNQNSAQKTNNKVAEIFLLISNFFKRQQIKFSNQRQRPVELIKTHDHLYTTNKRLNQEPKQTGRK